MDFKLKSLAWYVMPTVVALALAGCGGSDSSSSTTTNPTATLPSLPASPSEAVSSAAANELVLNVVDIQTAASAALKAAGVSSAYQNWSLYLWNGSSSDNCPAANDALDPTAASTSWDDVSKVPTSSDTYGPTWHIKLTKNSGCINFILRDGSKNKLINANMTATFDSSSNRMLSYRTGDSNQYSSRAAAYQKVVAGYGVKQAAAHLIDAKTLLWDGGKGQTHVRLYYSSTGNIGPDGSGAFNDKYVELTATTLTSDQQTKLASVNKALKDLQAFTVPDGVDIKTLLQGELVALSTNDKGVLQNATQVQYAGALDDLYSSAASQLQYGAIVGSDNVTFRVWAPTAQKVSVVVYDASKQQVGSYPMTLDAASGAWSYKGDTSLNGKFYRYALTVYHPASRKVEQYEVTDPYSLSLSTNSVYSQVVDLEDASLKPAGWDSLTAPHAQKTQADLAKMVIHESQIRDLTAADTGVDESMRGKFVALTQSNSLAVQHLKDLSKAGVTHIHLLPVFDIATVNEDSSKVANLDDQFSKLCSVNPSVASSAYAAYCTGTQTISQVLDTLKASDSESNPVIQDLYGYIRDYDSYNWGYDPYHYTTPEGSYSTNPDGTQRILEMREMVQALKKDIGLNVIMDVVYNHTDASGPTSDYSVLDKVVPWYYQRQDNTTGAVNSDTCCSDTAPEHAMYAKLIDDSLVTWAKEYKIDGFRFDLMGFHPLKQIEDALTKVKAVNPEMYFYGEGWNYGAVVDDTRFVQARQANMAGSGIGTFSDRLRDAVRGGGPFDSGTTIRKNQGFGNGAYAMANEQAGVTEDSARHLMDLVELGMAGNLKDFTLVSKDGIPTLGADFDYNGSPAGYAQDPIEIQNYVAAHDNQSLFDIISYKAPSEASMDTHVRMQAVSLAPVLLGQGIAFDQQGSELLRSKSFDRDTYNSGDWYNKVDYSMLSNNYGVGMPRKDNESGNYDLITSVMKNMTAPTSAQIGEMNSFYKELAALRQSSPLFTLGTGTEVNKRVDFRNVGPNQTDGVIAMTIDDGSAVTDLDPNLDGIVVIINATNATQSVGGFVDGSGSAIDLSTYQLSKIQSDLGSASIANGATQANGTFSVPAWSVAVFTKAQGSTQGTGLPLSKKEDMSKVAPFGTTDVYLPGTLIGSWNFATANKFTFSGANYSYTLDTDVVAAQVNTTTQIKISDSGWGSSGVNYGACSATDTLTPGTALKLCKGSSNNIPLTLASAGTYHFVFNAMNKTNPTLTVTVQQPAAACTLLANDTADTPPLGTTQLALRGDFSSWKWDATYQLNYKGNNIYQYELDTTTEFKAQFKYADNTSNWATQFYPVDSSGKIISAMTTGTTYTATAGIAGSGGSPNNTSVDLPAGKWLFQLQINSGADVTKTGNWATMSVCQIQ